MSLVASPVAVWWHVGVDCTDISGAKAGLCHTASHSPNILLFLIALKRPVTLLSNSTTLLFHCSLPHLHYCTTPLH